MSNQIVLSKPSSNGKGVDVTAVLTKVVQDQQRIIEELKAKIEALEGKVR